MSVSSSGIFYLSGAYHHHRKLKTIRSTGFSEEQQKKSFHLKKISSFRWLRFSKYYIASDYSHNLPERVSIQIYFCLSAPLLKKEDWIVYYWRNLDLGKQKEKNISVKSTETESRFCLWGFPRENPVVRAWHGQIILITSPFLQKHFVRIKSFLKKVETCFLTNIQSSIKAKCAYLLVFCQNFETETKIPKMFSGHKSNDKWLLIRHKIIEFSSVL